MKIKLIQYNLLFFLLVGCATTTVNPSPKPPPVSVFLTNTPIVNFVAPTATPTIITFKATVIQPDYCFNGPDDKYPRSISAIIPAGTMVDVLGTISHAMDWFMVHGESIDNCWIHSSVLLADNIALDKILIFITAFTASDSPCHKGPRDDYPLITNIPTGWRIVIDSKNNLRADWVKVTPHNSTEQCWIASDLLTEFDSSTLNLEPAPPTVTPTYSSQVDMTPTYPSPIELTWEIISYDCNNNGRVIGVWIDLDVSGGVPLYRYSSDLPVYTQPNEVVSITVYSSTSDGEPSAPSSYRVPNASDTSVFKCDGSGTIPGPTSPPKPPTAPPPTAPPPTAPPPTDPPPPPKPTATLCWPPGHCK